MNTQRGGPDAQRDHPALSQQPCANSKFDAACYSNMIGMRKPDDAIFQHVMKEQHALPGRTLFMDDSAQHVEGAKAVGLHAGHLDLAREDLAGLVGRLA